MNRTNTEQLRETAEKAKAALEADGQGGPWIVDFYDDAKPPIAAVFAYGNAAGLADATCDAYRELGAYLALVDPDTVLGLLEETKGLRRQLQRNHVIPRKWVPGHASGCLVHWGGDCDRLPACTQDGR